MDHIWVLMCPKHLNGWVVRKHICILWIVININLVLSFVRYMFALLDQNSESFSLLIPYVKSTSQERIYYIARCLVKPIYQYIVDINPKLSIINIYIKSSFCEIWNFRHQSLKACNFLRIYVNLGPF